MLILDGMSDKEVMETMGKPSFFKATYICDFLKSYKY